MDKVEVFSAIRKQGVGKKSGNPYDMVTAQCKVIPADGSPAFVGELTAPKGFEEVKPGFYLATFGAARSIDGKIVGQLKTLVLADSQFRPVPGVPAKA